MKMATISMACNSVSAGLRRFGSALVLTAMCTSAFAVPAELMDQDSKKGGLQDFSGQPVIVFVTSLTTMAYLGKWEEAIRSKLPDINTMDIGDIDTSSKFILSELSKELEKHVPSGVRIYLDSQNIWAKEYNLNVGEPCVLIFNADHQLVEKFRGYPKGDLLDQVVGAAGKYFPQKAAAAN